MLPIFDARGHSDEELARLFLALIANTRMCINISHVAWYVRNRDWFRELMEDTDTRVGAEWTTLLEVSETMTDVKYYCPN